MKTTWITLGFALLLACSVSIADDQGAVPSTHIALKLKTGDGDPLRGMPPLPERLTLASEPESGVFIVQFNDRVIPATLDRVRAAGAVTLQYVPDQAYLVRLAAGSAGALRALPEVRWLGALQPGWKIAPDLGSRPYLDPARREGGRLYATADLFEGEDAAAAARSAAATGAEVLQTVRFGPYARLKLHATREQLESVARLPAVSWIEEAAEIATRNNTTRWVVQTDNPGITSVWDRGIHGEGQIIGHIDGRIDMNSCWMRDASNNTPGPAHRKVVAYRSSSGLGADSHGTHTAGTSAGDQFPLNGTIDWNGNAYAAKISHSNLSDIDGSGTAPSNLYAYLDAAHADGARVHTNSWGDDGTTAYTTWCVDIDRFSYDREDALVMFAVTNQSILKTPENAKNCLAVGASSNGTADDNFCSGGRGPTSDGRRKPEIYAPGCSIVSARSGAACSTTSMTGTSMASPAVTAAAALVRQYFEQGWYPSGAPNPGDALAPTGALTKAVLLNAAVDMTGIVGYPSLQEGWGRVLLEDALFFEGDLRKLAVLDDVRNASGLTTGQEISYALTVEGSAEPLEITAVWTEPPAALLASAATVNDLDLVVVSPSGTTYLGNVFDTATGQSVTGGTPDAKNNVEQVIVPSPEAGTWTVRMRGAAVNQGTQGFAVVASGEVRVTRGPLRYAGHAIQDDAPLGNGDGIADPGETIIMPVTLENTSAATATGITARLRARPPAPATVTGATASWPDIAPSASSPSHAPHLRATIAPDAACGTRLSFDLGYASAAGNGTSGFGVEIGKKSVSTAAAGLPVTIPKNSSNGISATLAVAPSFMIADANVFVDVAHGNVGELVVQLRSPAGTSVTLHNKSRGGTANIVTTYDAERAPDGPGTMASFDGQPAQGTWTLTVVDGVGGSTPAGSLRGFRLDLVATTPISCSPLACADPVPGDVGATLAVTEDSATDLRLTWSPAAGAAVYRIWSASLADFSDETVLAETAAATFVDTGAAASPNSRFYRVHAINSCSWQGP